MFKNIQKPLLVARKIAEKKFDYTKTQYNSAADYTKTQYNSAADYTKIQYNSAADYTKTLYNSAADYVLSKHKSSNYSEKELLKNNYFLPIPLIYISKKKLKRKQKNFTITNIRDFTVIFQMLFVIHT